MEEIFEVISKESTPRNKKLTRNIPEYFMPYMCQECGTIFLANSPLGNYGLGFCPYCSKCCYKIMMLRYRIIRKYRAWKNGGSKHDE